jgi:tRNA U34 5-carboxymethylaminomethyl modifying enzyme MnmG/GidA
MAAGALNYHARQTAIGNEMNVIRPETLQRLVELKAKYKGAVNLLELKRCLESTPFGEDADAKLNAFVEQSSKDIRIRKHIIEALQQLAETDPDRKQFEVIEIRAQYNASFAKLDGEALDNQTVHEILIELSSPLTGYLGRIRGTSLQTDRFYFLRQMSEAIND